ncbi:MAG: Poly(3-hydroxybutyrate) depolymerase-like protein [Caulobacteraceae bacterium]|nr:Poly(3-hydroxybutyrate) depolymerase-like protein [Caulobacteraceae bacterium]
MQRMTILIGLSARPGAAGRDQRMPPAWLTWLMAAVVLALSLVSLWATGAKAADAYPLVENTVKVDGVDRTYAYYASPKANSWTQGYAVFALHSNGQTAEQFAEQSGWAKLADENGFVVVFPKAEKAWSSTSGANEEYLKAVFEDARTHVLSRFPGDRAPAGAAGGQGAPRRAQLTATHTYLTGAGAGGVAAQEFAIDHPGMVAGIATLDGAPFAGAYVKGDDVAENIFQYGRGKSAPPTSRELKKEVPVAAWLFSTTAQTPGLSRQVAYWKRSNAVGANAENRTVSGLQTTIYSNPQNEAQQVRTTVLPAGAKYDEVLASAVWNDFFSRTARWTSSPNGDLTRILTAADVDRTFELHTVNVDGAPYKYYVKLPSSYKKGQALPVVISLHGGAQPAWLYMGQIRMHEVGEKEGFITVYPVAAQRNIWTAADFNGPDAKGIAAVVDDVIAAYGADRSRVYLHGFSVGSRMATTTALTRPQLFAAISPNSGFPPFAPEMQAKIAELKGKMDYRMPTFAVSGSADADASADGRLPGKGQLQGAVEAFKAYNHITTADRVERFEGVYTAPYDVFVPQGRLVHAGVDRRYPAGRFQIYKYMSADPKPLELLDFVWVTDMPHSNEPRQAQLVWDYLKHWSRNPDGTVAYRP